MILPELCRGATQANARSERLYASCFKSEEGKAGTRRRKPWNRYPESTRLNWQLPERRAKEKNPKDYSYLKLETMLEIYEAKSLFGDISLHYFDPIKGQPKFFVTDEQNMPATKTKIKRELMTELCLWFMKERYNRFDFMVKANPQYITPEFRKNLAQLTDRVNQLPLMPDLESAAFFTHLHIYPTIMNLQPRNKNLKTDIYMRLARELDALLSLILADDVVNVKTSKKELKTVNY